MSSKDQNIESSCPFNIGDLVKMRKSHLALRKFWHYPKDDVGVVVSFRPSGKEAGVWLITVYWQKFVSKKNPGGQQLKHLRLKKASRKKDD